MSVGLSSYEHKIFPLLDLFFSESNKERAATPILQMINMIQSQRRCSDFAWDCTLVSLLFTGTDGPDNFTLSTMFFTYTGLDPSVTKTTLKMCSAAALSSASGNTVVTVVFGTPGTRTLCGGGLSRWWLMCRVCHGVPCSWHDRAHDVHARGRWWDTEVQYGSIRHDR